MNILVDMDGVLCDFHKKFLENWRKKYPNREYIELKDTTDFYITNEYPEEYKEDIKEIYNSPNFFSSLDPIEGGINAIKEMVKLGHEVFICTAPLDNYDYCVLEKMQWIEKHLGKEFVKKMIISYDKTHVKGDILIDDMPEVKGSNTPEWEHVIFDRPYNRNVNNKRKINWVNWKEVLKL